MKTGTCFHCEKQHAVVRGKLVEHTCSVGRTRTLLSISDDSSKRTWDEKVITQRCLGSGDRPEEAREKERGKRKAKKQAEVVAVRDVSSVILDAQLIGTKILDAEFPTERRAELLKLALAGYRLEYPKARKIENGILWWTGRVSKGVRGHKLFCRFCGIVVARLPIGGWQRLTQDERKATYENHVIVCTLQYLAGVRKIVTPGTMLDGFEGELFASALGRQCRACGAPPGTTCIAIDYARTDTLFPEERVIVRHLDEPHEIRKVA